MSLSVVVTPGHVFEDDVPFDADDLNAAATPSVAVEGSVGATDLEDGAFTASKSQPGAYWYGADSGSVGNAYVVVLSPALASLANGAVVFVKIRAGGTNTSAATLEVNGLTASSIHRPGGASLLPGDIRAEKIYAFQYNSTSTAWEVLNPSNPDLRWCGNTGGILTAYTATSSPTLLALSTGVAIAFRASVACGNDPTLALDGLTAKKLLLPGGLAIKAGMIAQYALIVAIYDAAADGAAGAWTVVSGSANAFDPTDTPAAYDVLRVNAAATQSEWAAPAVVQKVVTQSAATAVSNTSIPWDDTIPEKTDGTEFAGLETAFTPRRADSRLRIELDVAVSMNAGAGGVVVAVFVDAVTNAIAASGAYLAAYAGAHLRVVADVASTSTDARTYKVRFGVNASGDYVRFNGIDYVSGAKLGGVMNATLAITEYA